MSPAITILFFEAALASAVALILFGLDKSRARRGHYRIAERTLHVASLLGGWPGSLLAMQVFRHKRRKPAFVATTILCAAAHAAACIALIYLLKS